MEGVIMIRLFDRLETNLNHNKIILSPLSCSVLEEANGMFEIECEVDKSVSIGNGDLIKAPTPRGEQIFRIYRTIKTLKGKKAYGKHIFYDLASNFIIGFNPTNVSCDTAIKGVLSNAQTSHSFTASSDILNSETTSFVRISPIQAILGENGIIDTWGGNLVRNGFNIQIKASGLDRGYDIRMGKNLIGVEDDSDESTVITRLYPTVVLGDSDEVIPLPELYVDSPFVNNYGEPIIKEQRIDLTDEQKTLPIEQIYTIMRNYCSELFVTYNIDKPIVNYKIDFVELSKTEQYKDLAILEQLDLYDLVTCHISQLDINVKAKVIKYKFDCLKQRYDSVELGGFKSVSEYQTDSIVKRLQERIKATQSAVEYATEVITGNKGGHIITRRYPNGQPYEILIMDTENINTAQDVLRINNSGIGFSRSGYNGPYGTAMTLDGHIVADFMDTGTLTAILLESANYIMGSSGMRINLADGSIDSAKLQINGNGGLIQSGNYNPNVAGMRIDLGNGIFDSKYFKLNSEGKVAMTNGTINIETSSAEQSVIKFSFGSLQMELSAGVLRFTNATTNKSLTIRNTSNVPFVTFFDNGIPQVSISTQGIDMVSGATLNGGTPITSNNIGDYSGGGVSNTYDISAYFSSSSLGSNDLIRYNNTSGTSQGATADYVASKISSSSDERVKENIKDLGDVTEKYMQLQTKEFNYKDGLGVTGICFGYIAQKINQIFDKERYSLVEQTDFINDKQKELCPDGMYEIRYNNLHALHTKMIQKHEEDIRQLRTLIEGLTKE